MSPKLKIIKGGGKTVPSMYLDIPIQGTVPVCDIGQKFLECDLQELAEYVVYNSPGELYGIAGPPQGETTTTGRINALDVLALLEDAVNFCAPEPETWTGDEYEYDLEDYDTRLLASALSQLDTFLERKPIIALLDEGRIDVVREWYIDSVLNQPYWIDTDGYAHLREDKCRGTWFVDEDE